MASEQDTPEIADLIAAIEKAFDGVRREYGVTLHEARVLDYYGSEVERIAARKKDTDTRWQDVRDEWIEELGDDFTFLDPLGARYYLPVFMIWILRHPEKSDLQAAWGLISHLLGRAKGDEFHRNMFLLLEPPEEKAVAMFLQYVAGHPEIHDSASDDAATALSMCWAKHL